MSIPVPGKPVRGSQSGDPVMAVFDLLGRRWAMGIVWNLSRGSATFRELQKYCETISPTILNSRLKELVEVKIIEKTLAGYILTDHGHELFKLLKPFGPWATRWAELLSADEQTEKAP